MATYTFIDVRVASFAEVPTGLEPGTEFVVRTPADGGLTRIALFGSDWMLAAKTSAIEARPLAAPVFSGLPTPAINLTNVAAGLGEFVMYGQDAIDQSGVSVSSAEDFRGGAGYYTAVYGSPRCDHAISRDVRTATVSGTGSVDTPTGIERLQIYGGSLRTLGHVERRYGDNSKSDVRLRHDNGNAGCG